MAPDRVRLTVAEARRHAELALMGLGYDAEEAAIIADHAIDAALCGYEYSGLAKLLNIPRSWCLKHLALRGFSLCLRSRNSPLTRDPNA